MCNIYVLFKIISLIYVYNEKWNQFLQDDIVGGMTDALNALATDDAKGGQQMAAAAAAAGDNQNNVGAAAAKPKMLSKTQRRRVKIEIYVFLSTFLHFLFTSCISVRFAKNSRDSTLNIIYFFGSRNRKQQKNVNDKRR